MFEIASTLSIGHTFVRGDLFEVNDKIYFSEMNFTPVVGFSKDYSEKTISI